MPSNTYCPRFGLLTTLDARTWAGTDVVRSAGAPVAIPAYSGVGDGLFSDVLAFLNGHCVFSGQSIPELATSGWTGAGAPTFTAGIDENDRVWLESDTHDFSVTTCVALGFIGIQTTTGAGPYRMTATNDWMRGNWHSGVDIPTLTPFGAAAYYTIADGSTYQDVRVALRPSTATGPDSGSYAGCLEAADNTGGGTTAVRWGLDADGHVYTCRPAAATLGWQGTSFRDRLGFSGAEVAVASGTGRIYTADYPCPGVIVPSRPLDSVRPVDSRVSSASSDTAGRVSRVSSAALEQWEIAFYVDGPYDDGDDLSQHYLRRWRPYSDDRVTLYQEWGDSRRRLDPQLVRNGGQEAYDLDYTSERYGYRGRIVGYLVSDSPGRRVIQWPQRIMRRSPLSMTLQEDSDG